MKRLMTIQEENIYRCRSHEFEGLTTKETAKRLNISEACVQRNLRSLKKHFSQLFPILTRRQKFIYDCIVEKGFSHKRIARFLDVSERTIDSMVAVLKIKRVYFEKPHKTIRYETYHDEQVKQRF